MQHTGAQKMEQSERITLKKHNRPADIKYAFHLCSLLFMENDRKRIAM